MAFEKQLAALRAYAAIYDSNGGKPVTNEQAGELLNMAGSTVVVTNGWFTEMKLLTRQKDEGGFVPSPEVVAYYKAHEWDPANAGEKLRPALERGWFAELLVPRLKFRAYEEREALTALAEASGASKDYEERLRILVEFMLACGLVVREGTTIKLAAGGRGAELPTEAPKVATAPERREAQAPGADQEEFTFILDSRRKRKVVVMAPHDITHRELERVKKWLDIQLVVDEPEAGASGPERGAA